MTAKVAKCAVDRNTEYASLRSEILKRIELRHQVIIAALTIAGVFLGFGAKGDSHPLVILVYPPIAASLAFAWYHNESGIRNLARYIRSNIERSLLFRIEPKDGERDQEIQDELNSGEMPTILEDEFKDNEMPLQGPRISLIDAEKGTKNRKWELTNGEEAYCIIRGGKRGRISVYNGYKHDLRWETYMNVVIGREGWRRFAIPAYCSMFLFTQMMAITIAFFKFSALSSSPEKTLFWILIAIDSVAALLVVGTWLQIRRK
ncbi:hypothetical protein ACFL6S_25135 [Candidatus Poribacteria bacterium]